MRRRCSCARRPGRCARRPRRTRRVRSRRSTTASARSTWSRISAWPTTTGSRRWCAGSTRTPVASVSYTLSKATNTTEPNGNGFGPNDFNQLGEEERGPSIVDQRHRAVIAASYAVSARDHRRNRELSWPRRGRSIATTGVDNNGDGSTNDRPVIDGVVVGRAAFRGTPLYDTSVFLEGRYPRITAVAWCCARRCSTSSTTPTCSAASASMATRADAERDLRNAEYGAREPRSGEDGAVRGAALVLTSELTRSDKLVELKPERGESEDGLSAHPRGGAAAAVRAARGCPAAVPA